MYLVLKHLTYNKPHINTESELTAYSDTLQALAPQDLIHLALLLNSEDFCSNRNSQALAALLSPLRHQLMLQTHY